MSTKLILSSFMTMRPNGICVYAVIEISTGPPAHGL